MGYSLTEIASGEDNKIFFDENKVYRLLPLKEADFILKILLGLAPHVKNKIIETYPAESTVEIEKLNNEAVLAHQKIKYISYPHEWCASMLKDAALFHLKLQLDLINSKLYLKDAHPWNVLFEKGDFKFVDVPSIVSEDQLSSLEHITQSTLHNVKESYYFNQIMKSMFIPYFILPLCGYANGKRLWVKKRIELTTLNAATDVMTKRDCYPPKKLTLINVKNFIKLNKTLSEVNSCLSHDSGDIKETLNKLIAIVNNIQVSRGDSDYKGYYSQKGELNPYLYNEEWNDKQKNVYHALNEESINTVMDVACNTGWYSIMAEKMGKQVVALDYDEACIEELYGQVKEQAYNILPIWSSFLDLTNDRYSVTSGKRVLINFTERMKCDAVIALGIIHHLVLGMGLSFDAVLEKLKKCTSRKLVVEFVALDDEMIVKHPDFFAAYHQDKNQFAKYDIESFVECGKKYFSKCEILSSYPQTRSIVVFED